MKYLALCLALLCSACATHRPVNAPSAAVTVTGAPKTAVSPKEIAKVRTPETVKVYPVGRYTDPNFPDEMHERHTVYRREQSPDWNYQPSEPFALPLGPATANSDPSPSYYLQADAEQISAQQRAYADSLAEQNRAMKKRLDALLEEKAAHHDPEKEAPPPEAESAPSPANPPAAEPLDTPKLLPHKQVPEQISEPLPEPVPEGFSSTSEPFSDGLFSQGAPMPTRNPFPSSDPAFTDPLDLMLFPQSLADDEWFLFSQMRLNDDLAKDLAAAEWRRFRTWLMPEFLSFTPLTLIPHPTDL